MDFPADMDADALYREALEQHLAGALDQASAAYRTLLAQHPGHAEANHNLGMIEFAAGKADEALGCLMNAVEAAPGQVQFWQSLIEVLYALGAEEHAEQALAQAGAAGLAEHELAALHKARSAAPAINGAASGGAESPAAAAPNPVQAIEASIRVRAREVVARSAPGIKRKIARSRPLSPKLAEKMVTLFREQRHAELEALARQLTHDLPNNPAGWHFLGNARLARGDLLAGLQDLLRANELFPGDAQLLGHLGTGLARLGYLPEADACFQCSVANRHPSKRTVAGHIEVLRNLVLCKITLGALPAARQLAEQLLALVPDDAMANHALASVLMAQGETQAAIPYLERATALNPGLMGAFQDLGLALFNTGRLEDALRVAAQAVEKNPEVWQAYSNLLFFLSHDERISPSELFERHVAFGERFEAPLRGEWRPHENDPDPQRKLRVGFVSADFNSHAVAAFIEPILENIDRERFDLYGFYNNTRFDKTTARLKQLFRLWIVTTGVSDRDLAEIIRAAKIDILIDLSGHTAGSRLMTFARKPAPVQVSWIGYPNTTGLHSIDYHFADRFNSPEGRFDHLFSEKIVRLPSNGTFQHPDLSPAVNALPALSNGHLTFGSFNRLGKVSETSLDLWASVMHACPQSRMLIGAVPSDGARDSLITAFSRRGIEAERLSFETRRPAYEYLALHHRVDLILDTVPYPGGTTSNLAVWMGVPVLTMEGASRIAHGGAGSMRRIGLDEFVARDPEDFVCRALNIDAEHEWLAEVRRGLRQRLRACRYRDPIFITRGFERALRSIWSNWCERKPPRSMLIPDHAE